MQPKPEDYDYELDQALSAVVGIRALVPPDAFTAEILGTERVGHGALIRKDGIVLTIGYLVTEAETVWITPRRRHRSWPCARLRPGDRLRSRAGAGPHRRACPPARPIQPRPRSACAWLSVARGPQARGGGAHHRQAGIFRLLGVCAGRGDLHRPAHPFWGGTAMIGPAGDLLGIGSLQIQQSAASPRDRTQQKGDDANMIVPIDLLKPIFDDLITIGRPNRPARPWLGLYATEIGNTVAILACRRGPAQKADLRAGDIVLSVAGGGDRSRGPVPARMGAGRSGRGRAADDQPRGPDLRCQRAFLDRRRLLKGPVLH